MSAYNKIQKAIARKRRHDRDTLNEARDPALVDMLAGVEAAGAKAALPEVCLTDDDLRRNRILIGSENESVAVSYKILRTQVFQEMSRNGLHTLGITSANPAEGKTTTAINLAHLISLSVTDPVILVDLDLHKPSVVKTLGVSVHSGVHDYLTGEAGLSDVLYKVQGHNMLLIPGSKPVSTGTELVSSPRMGQLLEELKTMYPTSYIFFDLPPVLAVDDAMQFSAVDANLIVASESATTQDDLYNAMDLLKGHNIIGYVLNKSKNLSRKSKYGSYYYYTYGYGQGRS